MPSEKLREPRLATLICLGIAVICGSCGGGPKLGFDNVVLITIDTLRADHVGAYGYPRPTTPFIDSVAERGIVFENAFSSSSHTAPSHSSMFTSLYPQAHGVLRNGVPMAEDRFTTLADAFGAEDFATAGFTSVGFLKQISQGFGHLNRARSQDGQAWRPAEKTVTAALDWLDGHPSETQRFLWLHLFDVHRHAKKRGPHLEFLPRMTDPSLTDPAAFQAYLDSVHMAKRNSANFRRHMLYYDAQLAYVDSQVERFVEGFTAATGGARTLWIITADHGEGLGSHGLMGHGRHLYNEQLRVPLIMFETPTHWSPQRLDQFVRLVDLYPTILELAEAEGEAKQAIEGISLVPLLSSPEATLPIDYVYAQRRPIDERRSRQGWGGGLSLAVQNLEEKYVYSESQPDEYFDLVNDPDELNNLADQNLPEADRLKRWLLGRYMEMQREGPETEAQIEPEHLEELRALGYLD